MRLVVLLLTPVLGVLAACSPAVSDSDTSSPATCTAGQTRCDGDNYQTCQNGVFTTQTACVAPKTCSPTLGCAACDPAKDHVCQNGDSYTCNSDGTIGAVAQTCGAAGCDYGVCNTQSGCDAAGVKLIYLVDVDDNLISFDPGNNNALKKLGKLSCPAGAPLPSQDNGNGAHPFSMSVDRTARAWILYTSGEIFWVGTDDLKCQASPYVKSQAGYDLFGMGFVTDAVGGTTEKLYLAGGTEQELAAETGRIAVINPATPTVTTTVGPHYSGKYSPELTGTGDAKLYAYFPAQFVANVNLATGANGTTWKLPSVGFTVSVTAWAFAFWGGKFYMFVTEEGLASKHNRIYVLDPAGGTTSTLLADTPYKVVGAGVSTCAPIQIN